jgi:putative hemolysin
MTNYLLRDVPELARHCIFVEPVSTRRRSRGGNRPEPPRECERLSPGCEGGGMLAVFPAGEVSHWQFPQAEIADPALERHRGAADPAHGRRGAAGLFLRHGTVSSFHLFGMIHPHLQDRILCCRSSSSRRDAGWKCAWAARFPRESVTQHCRRPGGHRVPALAHLLAGAPQPAGDSPGPRPCVPEIAAKVQAPVAAAEPVELLREEVEGLPADRCLAENGDLAVYLAKANETPRMLQELGRLREITFRLACEGTGKGRDLDRFDPYYWHIFLWHKVRQELVGAYRAGNTAEILSERGVSGLYTSTLFRYDARVFEKIGPALELGRSFVRPEYQRQYAPLLLLWKGIARLLATHAAVPVLFGAVSISNDYSKASREMIYRFFEARMGEDELAGLIEPRRPFRPTGLRPWDCRAMCHALRDLEELSEPITDVETDGKGLPILLRQYAKIGGKLLGFNVDRKFSNVLDGLVVVDLRKTEPALLERYMGREAAARFRQRHGSTIVTAGADQVPGLRG